MEWIDSCDSVVLLQNPGRNRRSIHGQSNFTTGSYFSGKKPVVIIKAALFFKTYRIERKAESSSYVIHVYRKAGKARSELINRALLELQFLRPALCLFDESLLDYYISRYSPLKIFALLCDHEVFHENNRSLLRRSVLVSNLVFDSFDKINDNYLNDIQYKGVLLDFPYDGQLSQTRISFAGELKNLSESKPFDAAFEQALNSAVKGLPDSGKLNILMLCDDNSLFTNTVREYLDAFMQKSGNNYDFAHATNGALCKRDLSVYDAVVIHYSVRQCFSFHMSPQYIKAMKKFGGYKLLMMQDEYDNTENARRRIAELGIHEVFSIVPEAYLETVYPKERFPHVKFNSLLTGYVTDEMIARKSFKPIEQREFAFCYRGRSLPYRYGARGQEKINIGKDIKQICEQRGIPCDIEWDTSLRIYGEAWNDFISNSRAMLATESGSNIFDYDGSLERNIESELENNANLTFDYIFDKYLKDKEGEVKVDALSPKMFEAVSLGTALVMYEGYYSGVFKPDRHYIALKKDYSNIDEVIEKVNDLKFLEELTGRAFREIILEPKYSYQALVSMVDMSLAAAGVYHPAAILYRIDENILNAPVNLAKLLRKKASAVLRIFGIEDTARTVWRRLIKAMRQK